MTAVAPQQPEDGPDRRAALLFSLRDNKPKEAIKLLKEGTGVDFRDQTGCYPLHYAAQKGYTDVVDLLLENGALTHQWDNNGQTALHKAAMQGHVRVIVSLVARGAKVDIIDKNGRLPLEYAIRNKHVAAVELLCQFGSEPILLDWEWLKDPYIRKKKEMFAIANILKKQLVRMSGYKHRSIRFDVALVAPGDTPFKLKSADVEVKVTEGQEPYYLYMSQIEETYGESPTLDVEEKAFGNLIECQAWGSRLKAITLTVTVDRALQKNEKVVLRPATKLGGVDKVEMENIGEQKVTKVTFTIPMPSSGIFHFAMATKEKKEVFKISNEAVTLKPELEPEAEIDIPANTFKSGELSINFVDTTYVNEEAKENVESGKTSQGPLLMTNVLALTTSDGQQPSNDIKMKIPVTTKDKSKEFVVLSTSDPDPNLDEWIWEKIPAEIDETGKAVFNISHFSIYAGTTKTRVDEDEKSVTDAIQQAELRERKINFLVMVNKPEPNVTKTDVVILCGTQRKTRSKERRMGTNYVCFKAGTTTFMIPEGQNFQIRFHGNVKESTGDVNLTTKFISQDTVSSRAFKIESSDTDLQEMNGSVEILKEKKFYPEVDQEIVTGCWWCRTRKIEKVKSKDFLIRTETLVTIPFNMKLTKMEPIISDEIEGTTMDFLDDLDRKDRCMIPALRWKYLREITKMLVAEEALQLGLQLGIRPNDLEKILNQSAQNADTEFAFNILRKWRLRLPGYYQAIQLQDALIAIGKNRIADRMSSEGIQTQHNEGEVSVGGEGLQEQHNKGGKVSEGGKGIQEQHDKDGKVSEGEEGIQEQHNKGGEVLEDNEGLQGKHNKGGEVPEDGEGLQEQHHKGGKLPKGEEGIQQQHDKGGEVPEGGE